MLKEDGESQRDSNDTIVYLPFKTAQRLLQQAAIQSFTVSESGEDTLTMAENAVDRFLLNKTGDEDSYTIVNQAEIAESVSNVSSSLSLMLGGIAGISLLVGGIGIMNIMLVSGTERTREIGIRKAIGAKKQDILAQFMTEAVVLSFMGGITGIILSFLILAVGNAFVDTSLSISPVICVISLIFSAAVGIIFGLYPANKAANLKPVEALHYEKNLSCYVFFSHKMSVIIILYIKKGEKIWMRFYFMWTILCMTSGSPLQELSVSYLVKHMRLIWSGCLR